MSLYPLIRPLLFALPPEKAHHLALGALRYGWAPRIFKRHYPRLATTLWDLPFNNPLGLAAGFDKNAACVNGLLRQGFGSIELGTVTPRPQIGNPLPRLFRLKEDDALINRLGFNNDGMETFCANLARRKRRGIVGVNISKNFDSTDATADYVALLKRTAPFADYITVNVSSPNTEGLRSLQEREQLKNLLKILLAVRSEMTLPGGRHLPILVKIAPDLTLVQRENIADVALQLRLDGLIISNTTLARPDLKNRNREETGGLSGKPLFAPSTQLLREMYTMTRGKIPLIGVGGISSGADAYTKIKAGASLVQIYSSIIYKGLGIVNEILSDLNEHLTNDGLDHISQAVGVEAA